MLWCVCCKYYKTSPEILKTFDSYEEAKVYLNRIIRFGYLRGVDMLWIHSPFSAIPFRTSHNLSYEECWNRRKDLL